MNLGIHLIKNPAGTYCFRGTVPVFLIYVNKDGSELSAEEAIEVARANYPAMLAKSRVFEHPADALELADKFGIHVNSIDKDAEAELRADGYMDEKDYGDRG
jgi:hypothetical protein